MSEENLFELLDLSIRSPDKRVVVDFTALRGLLLGMLKRLSTERGAADGKQADAGRDVDESRPEEQKVALEQLSRGTELLTRSTSEMSGQVEDTEESATKYMKLVQDLKKEIQELKEETCSLKEETCSLKEETCSLKEETCSLKEEVEKLQKQSVTWEDLHAALITERQMKQPMDNVTGTGVSDTSIESNVPFTAVSDEAQPQLADRTLSQDSSGDELYPETPESLTDVGRIQEKHESLEARVERLEGDMREQKNLLDQVNQLKTQLENIVMVDRKKVYELEPLVIGPVTVSESSGLCEKLDLSEEKASQSRDSISGLEQWLHLQTVDLRNVMEKLNVEMENMKQELLVLRMDQKRNADQEMQDKTSELASDVQGSILQLQAASEKFHSTASPLMEGHMQEESCIENLYKTVKELDEKKADKKKLGKFGKEIKADMHALETRVLLCNTKTEQLNRVVQDLLHNVTSHEENCRQVNEMIFSELDCKLNRTELDPLKELLVDFQTRIPKQVDVQPAAESDDAAILKKQLRTKFKCLSCERPVDMITPGPPLLDLAKLPRFLPSKHHRRLKPYTDLGQFDRSPTKMEQTQRVTLGQSDSRDFDGHVHKEHQDTSDVTTVEMRPKEGSCKRKDTVDYSPGVTSSGRKLRRLLPLRVLRSKPRLSYSGSNCTEKEEQRFLEDCLPKILSYRQQVSSVPSAKKT